MKWISPSSVKAFIGDRYINASSMSADGRCTPPPEVQRPEKSTMETSMSIIVKKIAPRFRLGLQRLRVFLGRSD
jgi:hypothetical protein